MTRARHRRSLMDELAGAADVLDEPRRRDRHGARRVRRDRLDAPRSGRGDGGPSRAGSTASSSTPRSPTPNAARSFSSDFLHHVAGCPPTWTNTSIIEDQVAAIRAQVGDERVLCALSGGVDSAVAAALVTKAVGDQLTCVFVDTGLMREGEGEQIEETFTPPVRRRADPREGRRTASSTRSRASTDPEAQAQDHRRAVHPRSSKRWRANSAGRHGPRFLVQGTLYPDVIESGTRARGQHQEPPQRRRPARGHRLRARRTAARASSRTRSAASARSSDSRARSSGASRSPGPGLACADHRRGHAERAEILRNADYVVVDEIKQAGLDRELWQAFAVLPAVRTVGVMGDGRTYAYPIIIRAVTSDDAMTADWARLPYDVIERIANRLIREVDGVNRVASTSRASRRAPSSGSEPQLVLRASRSGRPDGGERRTSDWIPTRCSRD